MLMILIRLLTYYIIVVIVLMLIIMIIIMPQAEAARVCGLGGPWSAREVAAPPPR